MEMKTSTIGLILSGSLWNKGIITNRTEHRTTIAMNSAEKCPVGPVGHSSRLPLEHAAVRTVLKEQSLLWFGLKPNDIPKSVDMHPELPDNLGSI